MTISDLIIITNRDCNNRCDHCDPCNYNNTYIPINVKEFKQIIKDFRYPQKILLFGGEPSLHDKFYDFLKLINEKNICFGMITNGWMFENEKLTE